MNPLGQPRVFSSVYQEDPLLFTSKVFLSQTEMATTVGATLTSSKLVVTQGDLHLIGSSVDQLVLYFDQAAFDKFLATARVKTDKTKKHRRQTRVAGAQYILAASSPPWESLFPSKRGRVSLKRRTHLYFSVVPYWPS